MKMPRFGIVLSICKVRHKEQGRKRSITVRFGDMLTLLQVLSEHGVNSEQNGGGWESLALFRIKFGEGRQITNAGKDLYHIR